MTTSAIIVAAGSGQRMSGPIAKQYIPIGGVPILVHTLRVFNSSPLIDRILLVVSGGDFDYCYDHILPCENFSKEVTLVAGGSERQESVYNGLLAAGSDPDDIVVIHDGVRPFLTLGQISDCVQTARAAGACILGLPVVGTLKRVDLSGIVRETVDRDGVWEAQTPQAFRFSLIKKAHEVARKSGWEATDDSKLLERLGADVKIVRGSRNNLKITTREDLVSAQAIYSMKNRK